MTFDIEQFVGDCHNSLADDVPQKAIRPVAKAMTTRLVLVTALSLAFLSQPTTPANGADAPPAWAYPMTPPGFKLPPDDGKLHHVPNSSAAFTTGQLQDRFFTKDWRPDDHPPMPDIVAYGRKADVLACGHCHRADGAGGPENSSLTGLPAAYLRQQVVDFRDGARKSSVPQRIPVALMVSLSHAVTDDEVAQAAAYFSSLKPKRHIKVIETDTVPKTYVAWLIYAVSKDGGSESIGGRIVEVPDDLDQFESYDSRTEFTAYVPVGSVAKGEALVTSGGADKTVQCGICHGPDLKGLGPIPGIAGRSPSYIVRQLYDFKHGERAGPWSALMARVVANLGEEDFISLAAYLASREP
ncbi:c-type cytochrome [Bradyrhizobium sp.]|uniref:c-type cytochrome n=1 Tax=Bradyrhizobium sp. TaxID=376 RepID=UPI0025C38F03|nr:c-type cytochrome [Bradyrhizobium sp.]